MSHSGKLTVLLMAAKADLIQQYIDAFKERGITVSRVTVNLSGKGTLCRYIEKGTDTIFMEIDKNEFEGAIFLDGYISGILTGSLPLENEKSKIDAISGEILPLIDTLRTQGISPQIIFCLKGLSPSFQEQLKLQLNIPIKILGETTMKLIPSGPGKKVSYAAIGGVLESLWTKSKGLDLTKKGISEKQKNPFAITVLLILAILAMWGLYMVAPLRIEGKRLEEIDRQITLRKEDVKKVDALKKEIETINGEVSAINNFKGSRHLVIDVLRELTSTLPQTTWLTRVRITGTTVDIEGYASSATGLIPKLEASKYFKKAEFASPTFRDARQNADRFIIKMELEGTSPEIPKKTTYIESEDAGGGKTILFADVIRRVFPRRAWVVAHREELIFQARDKIERVTGIKADVEMGDFRAEGGLFGEARVVVSTIQTQCSGGDGGGRMSKFDPATVRRAYH